GIGGGTQSPRHQRGTTYRCKVQGGPQHSIIERSLPTGLGGRQRATGALRNVQRLARSNRTTGSDSLSGIEVPALIPNGPETTGLPLKEVAMQITIKGHQIDVTPALRQHAEAKLERLTRHFDHLHELSIVLSIEKLLHK